MNTREEMLAFIARRYLPFLLQRYPESGWRTRGGQGWPVRPGTSAWFDGERFVPYDETGAWDRQRIAEQEELMSGLEWT